MRIEIENGKLVTVINFMYELKLTRTHSRFRWHFINLMNESLKVVEEDRKELLKDTLIKMKRVKRLSKMVNMTLKIWTPCRMI
ncbi:hypothetical protein [Peribacillus simplex]|uniref:hypothetical protein n=1 Tax=Peribacillus simplex TaxID=1478 RepID=UPI003D2685E8